MTIFHRQDTVSDVTTRQNVSLRSVGCGTYNNNIIIFLNKQPRASSISKKRRKDFVDRNGSVAEQSVLFFRRERFCGNFVFGGTMRFNTPSTKQQQYTITNELPCLQKTEQPSESHDKLHWKYVPHPSMLDRR